MPMPCRYLWLYLLGWFPAFACYLHIFTGVSPWLCLSLPMRGWVGVSILDWGPWLDLVEGVFYRLPIGLWRRRWYLIMAYSVQISRA